MFSKVCRPPSRVASLSIRNSPSRATLLNGVRRPMGTESSHSELLDRLLMRNGPNPLTPAFKPEAVAVVHDLHLSCCDDLVFIFVVCCRVFRWDSISNFSSYFAPFLVNQWIPPHFVFTARWVRVIGRGVWREIFFATCYKHRSEE